MEKLVTGCLAESASIVRIDNEICPAFQNLEVGDVTRVDLVIGVMLQRIICGTISSAGRRYYYPGSHGTWYLHS